MRNLKALTEIKSLNDKLSKGYNAIDIVIFASILYLC